MTPCESFLCSKNGSSIAVGVDNMFYTEVYILYIYIINIYIIYKIYNILSLYAFFRNVLYIYSTKRYS